MKYLFIFASLVVLVAGFFVAASCSRVAGPQPENTGVYSATPAPAATTAKVSSDDIFDGVEVMKTEAEWKQLLTPAQYHILREAGTEAPYSGEYAETHEDGDYYCAACHLKLFSSKTKFESGTGWPSFYEPIDKRNVIEKVDKSFGETRTEVLCSRCHSHLGHVFDDGPKPTGLRYCMNSLALKFEKAK